MNKEMLYAKIAYIIPFSKSENELHEPALRVVADKNNGVSLNISLFFIGLMPGVVYTVSCSVSDVDDENEFPVFVTSKKFKMEDELNLGCYLPSAFDLPIEFNQTVRPGQYKIEAKLKSENSLPNETKKSICFIEIESFQG